MTGCDVTARQTPPGIGLEEQSLLLRPTQEESPWTGCSKHGVVWRKLSPAPHGRQMHRREKVSLPDRPTAVTVGGLTSSPRPPGNAVASSRPQVLRLQRLTASLGTGVAHCTGGRHVTLAATSASALPARRHAPSYAVRQTGTLLLVLVFSSFSYPVALCTTSKWATISRHNITAWAHARRLPINVIVRYCSK